VCAVQPPTARIHHAHRLTTARPGRACARNTHRHTYKAARQRGATAAHASPHFLGWPRSAPPPPLPHAARTTNTMFHTPLDQDPTWLLRVKNCCWDPEYTSPSTWLHARRPSTTHPAGNTKGGEGERYRPALPRRVGCACGARGAAGQGTILLPTHPPPPMGTRVYQLAMKPPLEKPALGYGGMYSYNIKPPVACTRRRGAACTTHPATRWRASGCQNGETTTGCGASCPSKRAEGALNRKVGAGGRGRVLVPRSASTVTCRRGRGTGAGCVNKEGRC
jgi:hypothetical protein